MLRQELPIFGDQRDILFTPQILEPRSVSQRQDSCPAAENVSNIEETMHPTVLTREGLPTDEHLHQSICSDAVRLEHPQGTVLKGTSDR